VCAGRRTAVTLRKRGRGKESPLYYFFLHRGGREGGRLPRRGGAEPPYLNSQQKERVGSPSLSRKREKLKGEGVRDPSSERKDRPNIPLCEGKGGGGEKEKKAPPTYYTLKIRGEIGVVP